MFRRNFPHHGRIYVSDSHLCFYSSIFGKITKASVDSEARIATNFQNSPEHSHHRFPCPPIPDSPTQLKIHLDEIVSVNRGVINLIYPVVSVKTWRHTVWVFRHTPCVVVGGRGLLLLVSRHVTSRDQTSLRQYRFSNFPPVFSVFRFFY